jgi:integrase
LKNMDRVKLTHGKIAGFVCPTGKTQAFLRDTEVPKLAVRVTAAGAKTYVFESKLAGKTIRTAIGDVNLWPISSKDPDHPGAREEARRLSALVDQGVDPRRARLEVLAENDERFRQEECKRIEVSRAQITVGEAWSTYVEARQKSGKWGARNSLDHHNLASRGGVPAKRGKRKTKPGVLASLMPLHLSEITPATMHAWLEQETASRPAQTRLAYGHFRTFLSWCEGRPEYKGIAAQDACTHSDVKDKLPAKRSKKDVLLREQLSVWFAAVRQISNPTISTYLQVLLLLGCRREELTPLKWSDIDFAWKSITIKDKVEGLRVVPLTPYVENLLRALKVRNETPPRVTKLRVKQDTPSEWAPSPWVFASPRAAEGYLQEPRYQHSRALVVAGIEGLTLHGLRRSFRSLTEWIECPVGVVAQIMGHKPSATAEKHYTVRPLDMLRMWHVKIEAWILEQAGIEFVPTKSGLHEVRTA